MSKSITLLKKKSFDFFGFSDCGTTGVSATFGVIGKWSEMLGIRLILSHLLAKNK